MYLCTDLYSFWHFLRRYLTVWLLVTFPDSFADILPYSSFCIYLSPSSSLEPSIPPFSLFPLQKTCVLLFLSLLFTHPCNVPFYLPGSCSYCRLCTHIWSFGARNLRWERTCGICLSGSGLPHSIWSFLVPFIYQQSSGFPFYWHGVSLCSPGCSWTHRELHSSYLLSAGIKGMHDHPWNFIFLLGWVVSHGIYVKMCWLCVPLGILVCHLVYQKGYRVLKLGGLPLSQCLFSSRTSCLPFSYIFIASNIHGC